MKIELAPSVLSSNFAQLGGECAAAIEGGGTICMGREDGILCRHYRWDRWW